jgi:hypothetical protein
MKMNKFLEAIHDMIEIITGERPETKRNGDRRSKDRGTPDRRAKGYTKEHTKQWLDSVKKPKRKRARKKDGTFRGDDKSTPDVNEAWEN